MSISNGDESIYSTSLKFLLRFQCLFDFKLTEFFIAKPYERLPSRWIDYLRSNLAAADDLINEGSNCEESCHGEAKQLLHADVCKLFLSTRTMPDNLRKFLVDAGNLTLKRDPWKSDSSAYPDIPLFSSRGLSPKKCHEITRLSAFLHDLACQQIRVERKSAEDVVFVDVGSGLGYLGEILSLYGYGVINVESEQSHCDGARRRQAKHNSTSKPTIGSGTQIVNINATLTDDSVSISNFNTQIWDCVAESLLKDPTRSIVILTGLHACGDLTPTMLKVFANEVNNPSSRNIKYRAVAVVGCCYHRMSPLSGSLGGMQNERRSFRQFPLSHSLFSAFDSFDIDIPGKSDDNDDDDNDDVDSKNYDDDEARTFITTHPSSFLSSFALRLAAQETLSRWRGQTRLDHERHSRHVAYRAILEVTLNRMKVDEVNRVEVGDGINSTDSTGISGIEKLHKKLVSGKIASFVDFDAYKASLLQRIKIKSSQDADEFIPCNSFKWEEVLTRVLDGEYEELKKDISIVEPITFLQYWLQGVLESLILEDRVAFLREKGVGDCKLVPLFEDHISPRNVAIVGIY